MASARIQSYASNAPEAAKEVALLRYVGYLSQMPSGALTKLTLGNVTLEFRSSQANAWVNSGAASALTSFKQRRGAIIGAAVTQSSNEDLRVREQQDPVDLTDVPVNIVTGLTAGTYEFQRGPGSRDAAVVIYAFGNTAPPTDTEDFFILGQNERIVFNTAASCWCRVLLAANPATLAISSI